jgi:hypothetical protein
MAFPRLDDLLLLALPALAVIATWWHHARVTGGRLPDIRALTGIPVLEQHLSEGVESGKPLHIATGTSRPGTIGVTAESLASLQISDRLAELAIRRGGSVIVTSGDIVNHTAVRGTLHRVYRESGLSHDYNATQAELVAHQTPIAYAAGVAGRYRDQPMDMSVVVGDYGAEVLLITDEGNRQHLPQVSGATSLSALPVLTLSTTATLVGEEVFAAEAYLTDAAAPRARLLTLDLLRWAVVLLIVVAMVYRLLDATLGLGLPAL